MLTPQALSQKIGKKILYVGTECRTWQVTDFAKCAKNARAMGFDTICPKRLDGTIKWYSTAGHLQLERQAVLSEGCGYLPLAYSYAPVFDTVAAEVAAWQEIANVNDGLVMVDMEDQWNGQVGFATSLANALSGFKGDIIVTTWGDPKEQSWMQIINILNSRVSAWSPQQYTNWLAAQESAEWGAEEAKVFPSIDITGEYGSADNPLTNIKQAITNKHPTLVVWEYSAAITNSEFIKGLMNVFASSATNITPTPIPHPPTPIKKVKWGTYIVQDGDTLTSIFSMLKSQENATTAATWVDLYNANKDTIELSAKSHGFSNSNGGNMIFPGTQLVYPY